MIFFATSAGGAAINLLKAFASGLEDLPFTEVAIIRCLSTLTLSHKVSSPLSSLV